MTPQYFKGDAIERKVDQATVPIMDIISLARDQFSDDALEAESFLLMLYDEGRMPFSDRIPRAAFISFLKECIANASFIGTFESYIFLIKSIFGEESSVFFEQVTPGVLTMTASSSNSVSFDFVARETSGGAYEFFEIITHAGENIEFAGFPGIESEAELGRLIAEFVPAGIFADITLVLFSTSLFLVETGDGDFTIVDDQNNDIIFFELGG